MAWDTEQAINMHPSSARAPDGPAHGRQWNRLPVRADFLRVAASGQRRATPGFILQIAPRPEGAAQLRIGFTASRKVGNAVARNRAKRRLRALADKVMPATADPARDYVLIGRGETLTRDFAAMEHDLRRALEKLSTTRPAGTRAAGAVEKS